MPKILDPLRARIATFAQRLSDKVEDMRGHNPFVRADFSHGGDTLYKYLATHRNKYYRHVGAHFLMQLYEAGPHVFEGFAEKHRVHGWHFELTREESAALRRARDITCTHSRISNLRYSTNVFEQITNSRQLMRMLGLGAVAGSAGILLGLGELFFFAKEASKDLITSVIGIDFDAAQADAKANSEFVELANEITAGAANADGSLDATLVAERIQALVIAIEETGSAETAVRYINSDSTYIIGILTGIVFLVVGRGLVQLILEGVNGAAGKIDALVCDIDDYANWKLGRSPFPSESKTLPGDILLPDRRLLLDPKEHPSVFRMPQHRR